MFSHDFHVAVATSCQESGSAPRSWPHDSFFAMAWRGADAARPWQRQVTNNAQKMSGNTENHRKSIRKHKKIMGTNKAMVSHLLGNLYGQYV